MLTTRQETANGHQGQKGIWFDHPRFSSRFGPRAFLTCFSDRSFGPRPVEFAILIVYIDSAETYAVCASRALAAAESTGQAKEGRRKKEAD